jgi:hypothetical protein
LIYLHTVAEWTEAGIVAKLIEYIDQRLQPTSPSADNGNIDYYRNSIWDWLKIKQRLLPTLPSADNGNIDYYRNFIWDWLKIKVYDVACRNQDPCAMFVYA